MKIILLGGFVGHGANILSVTWLLFWKPTISKFPSLLATLISCCLEKTFHRTLCPPPSPQFFLWWNFSLSSSSAIHMNISLWKPGFWVTLFLYAVSFDGLGNISNSEYPIFLYPSDLVYKFRHSDTMLLCYLFRLLLAPVLFVQASFQWHSDLHLALVYAMSLREKVLNYLQICFLHSGQPFCYGHCSGFAFYLEESQQAYNWYVLIFECSHFYV